MRDAECKCHRRSQSKLRCFARSGSGSTCSHDSSRTKTSDPAHRLRFTWSLNSGQFCQAANWNITRKTSQLVAAEHRVSTTYAWSGYCFMPAWQLSQASLSKDLAPDCVMALPRMQLQKVFGLHLLRLPMVAAWVQRLIALHCGKALRLLLAN